MSNTAEPPRSRIRASKACTACRQVKLRCDVSSKFPGSCTRCVSTSRVCRVDPSFKRTSTRNQLEQVTSQLADLRHRLATPMHEVHVPHDSREILTAVSSPAISSVITKHDLFSLKTIKADSVSPARLGVTHITPEQIYSLFSFFSKHQYEYMPILDERVSIQTIQNKHSLLFWTIVVVASRYHHAHYAIAESVKQAYHELLAKTLITAPITLSSIQALLLLCYWPYPCLKQIFDPSWNLYGIALNAARFLALHTPAESLSFEVSREDCCHRARIWLGCFHVGTILALHWGVPLPIFSISDLRHTKAFTESCTISHTFKHQLKAHLEIAQYRALVSYDRAYDPTLSATRLFESNIDDLGRSSASEWSEASEICQLRVKISLYATVLILARPESSVLRTPNDQIHTSNHSVILSGLHAASRLIHVFSAFCEKVAANTGYALDMNTQDDDHSPLLCIPKHCFGSASIATLFLISFCIFDHHINQHDKSMAENTVKSAYRLFDRLSKHRNDEFARTSAVIKVLSRSGSWKMTLIDRECASIWFDACRRAGDLRGRGVHEKFPNSLSMANQADDDSDNCAGGQLATVSDSTPSYDDVDPWLSLPDFSDVDWSLADHDIFGSMGIL